MIIYLAQAYSKDPEEAIRNAFEWTRKLRVRGFTVFSPVAHTHYYDQYHSLIEHIFKRDEDYVAWDLEILNGMEEPVIAFADDCLDHAWSEFTKSEQYWVCEALSRGCKREYNFARDHSIPCVRLQELLEKKEVEACHWL